RPSGDHVGDSAEIVLIRRRPVPSAFPTQSIPSSPENATRPGGQTEPRTAGRRGAAAVGAAAMTSAARKLTELTRPLTAPLSPAPASRQPRPPLPRQPLG